MLPGSSPITFTSPSSKAHQKSGPFPQPALPGFDGHTTLSDSRHGRRLRDVEAATLALDGSPPITRTTFPTCRAHYPGGSKRVRVSIASPLVQPSPNGRRVGIRIVTFEACSGFTHVTARRIAQPPKAAFVTRLQPCRLPGRTARQLPDQSTTLWVESSSTSDPRLRGALPLTDLCTAARQLVLVDASGLIAPFGLERQHGGHRPCREESPGSDAGSSPRRAPPDGLVRSH